jgi:uncharacterized RDD family membrane protein YckC
MSLSSMPPVTSTPEARVVGLIPRLAAYFLDVVISLSILWLAGGVLRALRIAGVWTPSMPGSAPDEIWHSMGGFAKLAIFIGLFLSSGPYQTLFDASPWQASFGKRVLGLYVTGNEGERIGIGRALGRESVKWIFTLFLWPISALMVAVTRKKKAFHDVVAGTLVLRGRPTSNEPLETWRTVGAFGVPFICLLATFLAVL